MINRYLQALLPAGALLLSACASQSEVREVHQEVSTLNQQLEKLNAETVKIAQQNALNAKSASGAFLLPGAHTPARLNSQLGMLKLQLASVQATNGGTQVVLHIENEARAPLPAFTGTLEWGELRGTTSNYREVNTQHQQISAPASPLVPGEATLTLTLPGIQPTGLGFIRLHDIQPLGSEAAGMPAGTGVPGSINAPVRAPAQWPGE